MSGRCQRLPRIEGLQPWTVELGRGGAVWSMADVCIRTGTSLGLWKAGGYWLSNAVWVVSATSKKQDVVNNVLKEDPCLCAQIHGMASYMAGRAGSQASCIVTDCYRTSSACEIPLTPSRLLYRKLMDLALALLDTLTSDGRPVQWTPDASDVLTVRHFDSGICTSIIYFRMLILIKLSESTIVHQNLNRVLT